MERCLQATCSGLALTEWWLLCEHHTLVLDAAGALPSALADQASAAGWDAADWAERIAPARWGHAAEQDPWVLRQRALNLASAVTRRTAPCPHTAAHDAAVPVVVLARAPGVSACPVCAETTVARTTTAGHMCDRCHQVPVGLADRTALLVGQALILVAQLCEGCATASLDSFRLPQDGV